MRSESLIKSIPTWYNGIKYRSKLEAKWAVFFTSLKLPFEYEKQGFIIGGECYLPDFYFPTLKKWLEIKPPQYEDGYLVCPQDHPMLQLYNGEFPQLPNGTFNLIVGQPIFSGDESTLQGDWEKLGYTGFIQADNYYSWCQCPECGNIGFEFESRVERIKHKIGCTNRDKYSKITPQLIIAYQKAMSERFQKNKE